MPPVKGRGIAYLRVSQDRQDHLRQVEDVERYLLKHKLSVVEMIEDAGSRLEAEKRVDFQRLRKMVEKKEVDWVILQTVDRLGFKQTLEFFSFLWEFKRSGVELWSAIEDRNLAEVDDGTVFRNAVAGQTSARELFEKANRAQSSRVSRGKQGKYLGGPPPYGFDVVCYRIGTDQEVWRYVTRGKNKGTQHYPDGVTVDVGGVPHHSRESEECYLRPSSVKERVDTLKWMFDKYDRESISSLGLAKELNARGVSAVIVPKWKHDAIWRLLQNSAVMGRPASNKVTSAKLLEYRDGELKERSGKGYERRPQDQWLLPEKPLFVPIVPEEQYWRVLEKIVGGRKKRAPKNPELWLAGLVVCGKCGVNMRGSWKEDFFGGRRQGTYKAHFFCTTRALEGANNAAGCRNHGVRQLTLEPFVRQFLAERGAALEELLGSNGDREWISKLIAERRDAGKELESLYGEMRTWVRDTLEAEGALDTSVPTDHGMVEDLYSQLHDYRSREMGNRLQALQSKHAEILADYFDLPAKAKTVAKMKLHEIEAEIEGLEKELEPLSNLLEARKEQWRELGSRIKEAQKQLESAELREKAEAVRRAIARIECHFEPEGDRGSKLVKVVITPAISGVSSEVTTVGLGCRDNNTTLLESLFTRVFWLSSKPSPSPACSTSA